MGETFRWWLVVEGVGLLGLPLAFVLFRRLPDRGYTFAKPVGVLFGAYLFWLALSLHVLPNRPGSIVWCYIALGLISAFVFRRNRLQISEELGRRLPLIIAAELMFTVVLFAGAHLRSYIPDIAGTEKPMDYMYINAASRSRFYPPSDSWLAGFSASYYYFGYVIQAMLGKLAALPTAVTFNLGIASTAALAATAAFGLAFNLVARRWSRGTSTEDGHRYDLQMAIGAGVAAALFVAVLGNLEGVLEFARAHGIGGDSFFRSMGIAHLAEAPKSSTWYPNDQSSYWWWWRATRISPDANSITEFPFFSFLLGDLHPHVMAIPFVLTSIGIGVALFEADGALNRLTWRSRPVALVAMAVFVGGLGFLNTWDLPTFGALICVLVVAHNLQHTSGFRTAIGEAGQFLALFAAVAVVAYLPFYLSFHTQASGLAAVGNGASRPLHAALFWLPLVVLTLPMALLRLAGDREARSPERVRLAALIPGVLVCLWALLLAADKGGDGLRLALSARGWNWLTALFFAFAFVCAALAAWDELDPRERGRESTAAIFVLMAVAYLLVFGAELFYVRDVFGSRLNTVFKLYYQAWLLLAIAAAAGSCWLLQEWRPPVASRQAVLKGAWAATAAVVLAAALLYPLGAMLSRTDGLASSRARTLDGLSFAQKADHDDVTAAAWLAKRAGRHETILEAVKGQYSDAARISEWTGVPALIGWAAHEQQWGRDSRLLTARQDDAAEVYKTTSMADALAILRKYNVTYVIVGSVERATYPAEGLQKFGTGLDVALTSGQTTIYRVPIADARPDVKAQ